MLKSSRFVYFCYLKKLVRSETFAPYYVCTMHRNQLYWFVYVIISDGFCYAS